MKFASVLMLAGAGIILLLGVMHLIFTFRGPKLRPRDPALEAQMRNATLAITPHTDVWRAWLGFNASHSLGAIGFGAFYAWLALVQPALLFDSWFLRGLAVAWLGAWLWLAARYWFRAPLTGVALATACTLAAFVVAQAG
jgi:hypothetical protein